MGAPPLPVLQLVVVARLVVQTMTVLGALFELQHHVDGHTPKHLLHSWGTALHWVCCNCAADIAVFARIRRIRRATRINTGFFLIRLGFG